MAGFPVPIDHTFTPPIQLMGRPMQRPVRLKVSVHCRADLSAPEDPDRLEAVLNLTLDAKRRQKMIEDRVRDSIETACMAAGAALISKANGPLGREMLAQLRPKFENRGIEILSVDVSEIELPEELYEEVMARWRARLQWFELFEVERRKWLTSLSDAGRQREFARLVPGVTMSVLLENDPETFRQVLRDSLSVAATALGRGGGADIPTAFKSLQELLNQFPGGGSGPTPAEQGPSVTVENVGETVSQYAEDAARQAERALPPPDDPYALEAPAAALGGGTLSTRVLADHKDCERIAGVRALQPRGNLVVIAITFEDAAIQRVRLTLGSLDDYPEVAPIVADCRLTHEDGEETRIKPSLRSLQQWHDQSTLRDVVQEIVDRRGQLTPRSEAG
jgi:hypothetical protein